MALRKDLLTASFLQMSNFCTETQFHLKNCLFLEKNYLQKKKKNSQWAIWPTGVFFLTPHPKLRLRASFCANKKLQAFCGKTLKFIFLNFFNIGDYIKTINLHFLSLNFCSRKQKYLEKRNIFKFSIYYVILRDIFDQF